MKTAASRDFKGVSMRKQLPNVQYDASRLLMNMTQGCGDMSPEDLLRLIEQTSSRLMSTYQEVEAEVSTAQETAAEVEKNVFTKLDGQSSKLASIQASVDRVTVSFTEASSGALRLGERLSVSESERKRIEQAEDLLAYIRHFEDATPGSFSQLYSLDPSELRSRLPPDLRKKDWGEISKVLYDLRRVVYELQSDDAKAAEMNVQHISEAVERELLAQFEGAVLRLIDVPDDPAAVEAAKNLATWLHLFNNGSALQKRFIFSVVERRIPQAPEYIPANGSGSLATRMLQEVGRVRPGGNRSASPVEDSSSQLIDHLSELFMSISSICQEQCSIIRQLFPRSSVSKVTRMLIARIFSDPAFGIQARVDSVLRPRPPRPPLQPQEYLDALVIVREKLSALYLLLLEFCSAPPSAEETAPQETSSVLRQRLGSADGLSHPLTSTAMGSGKMMLDDDAAAAHRRTANEELKSFLEEQVAQVFQGYIRDYFHKEIHFIKSRFAETLRNAVDDSSVLSKTTDNEVPRLKVEKLKSVAQLVKSVGTSRFVSSVLAITRDTVQRMENIGREDAKLAIRIKDVFMIELGFLTEGVFLPWAKALRAQLYRLMTTRQNNSTPPAHDYLLALGALNSGVILFRQHFEAVFAKPLSVQPNILTVCQESRRKALRTLDSAAQEALHGWIFATCEIIERTLSTMQHKNDYCPKADALRSVGANPTDACDLVCKDLLEQVLAAQKAIPGVNLAQVLWRPFCRQFIAILISHIKRTKISLEGAFILVRDCDEYHNVIAVMDCPEALDMIDCLREVAYVYMAAPENVVKVVNEDLRHIDTHIVMALLKARNDSSSNRSVWQKPLSEMFAAAVKWDAPLPWEEKKQTGIDRKIYGPQSLRKVPAKVLTVRNNLLTDNGNALIMRNTFGSAASASLQESSVTTRTSMISTAKDYTASSSGSVKSQMIKRKNSADLIQVDAPDRRTGIGGGSNSVGASPSSASSQTDSISAKSKRLVQSKGGAAPVLSPSSASAKSTMFNKVTSVFQFRSKNDRASFS